ncbi:hypothetical protein ACFQV2_07515 [Actinokineospora soli]|uniref:Uncharacterized protein n=1 Tax=Actinokineospora soli TaxID=1048753 RepID=A0ABW2TID0_9PSEU
MDKLEALHGRIDAATKAGDSIALRAAVDELRPVLDETYDVARSDMALYLADESDLKAAEIQRILPLGIPSPLDMVFGLVGSLLALVGGLIGTLIGLLPIPLPVPVPIPGVPAPEPGGPAPGLPLPEVPGVPGVPGVPAPAPGAPAPAPVPGLPLP